MTFKKKLAEMSKDGTLFDRYTKHDQLIEKVNPLSSSLSSLTTRVSALTAEVSEKWATAD